MAFDPVSAAFNIGGKLIDRLWPNPTEAAAAKLELVKMQQNGDLAVLAAETDLAKAQIKVNEIEAGSSDKFVSRWRPFIGWVCGIGFLYHVIVQPLILIIAAAMHHGFNPPPFDTTLMITTLGGILGVGTMRTVEKVRGVAR